MSGVKKRPESRTKEELKRELRKWGVDFHSNTTKDELVRLYRERKVGRSAMELSSDEEGSRSPARRQKVRARSAGWGGRSCWERARASSEARWDQLARKDNSYRHQLLNKQCLCQP